MELDWRELAASTRVEPGREIVLERDFDPGRRNGFGKAKGRAILEAAKDELFELQDRFYAQADRALLIVLQATDAAGKDGTIKHVMSGVNPEGVDVHSFKAPNSTDRAHDFLWRHVPGLPELGKWSVFNRSHYENVLVTRVHPELLWPRGATAVGEELWAQRYRAINDWERHLTENGTTVVKLFLNVSYEEQGKRFLRRLEDPTRNWKFSPSDIHERGYWDQYQEAFGAMLTNTSTEWAPWHVIPADRKWFGHLCTFAVLLETLRDLDPQYPSVDPDVLQTFDEAREELAGIDLPAKWMPDAPGHKNTQKPQKKPKPES